METKAAAQSNPSHEEIAVLAYHIYEQEGCHHGHSLDHWLQAELLLKNARNLASRKAGES